MLRVIGIQRHESADQEFVLLQNQGHMRLILRGILLASESAVTGKSLDRSIHAFTEEESIGPGLFVMLTTGAGEPHWGKTRDGAYVFHTFMNAERPFWIDCECPLHVMQAIHSFTERNNRTEFLVAN